MVTDQIGRHWYDGLPMIWLNDGRTQEFLLALIIQSNPQEKVDHLGVHLVGDEL